MLFLLFLNYYKRKLYLLIFLVNKLQHSPLSPANCSDYPILLYYISNRLFPRVSDLHRFYSFTNGSYAR